MKAKANLVFVVLFLCVSALQAHSQAKYRIAVLEFDARGIPNNGLNTNIGIKVADGLVSQLAGKGDFDVVDRDNLDRIMHEQNIGQQDRVDPKTAARIGKLANANIEILGRIESATESAKQKRLFSFMQVANINIKATARIIQVDTGNILSAPTEACEIKDGEIGNGTMDPQSTPQAPRPLLINTEGLQRKVDDCISQLSEKLAAKIREVSTASPITAIATSTIVAPAKSMAPKFVGVQDGLIFVNKGSKADIKIGDMFDVTRQTDTGLKDPDTGNPVYRKKKICTLTVTEVDDDNSSGKCTGGAVPQKDDIFAPMTKP